MARRWNLGFIVALMVLIVSCSSGADDLAGSWQLVSYEQNGEATVVEEGINTTSTPFVVFDDRYVWGNAGCNNFGDNGDFPYTYSEGVLNLGVLVKDSSECETMTTELFLEDVLWSGSDIAVEVADGSMTWNHGDATITFEKLSGSPFG